METLQETKAVGFKEETMPMFLTVKDGFGNEVKIANLDHEMWAPKTGIVQLEALKKNKRHTRRVSIKNSPDRETGAIFGIHLGVDRIDKNLRWEIITLGETEFFDLSKRKERQRYIVVSRHCTVDGSPNLYGQPEYRTIDKEKKAANYLQERSEVKRCREISDNLTFEQILELAPAFGIDPKANSQQMLTAEILRIADTDYKKFLGVWDNPDRKGMTTFKRAIKNGLINFDAINGYTYSGHQLGFTEPIAFKYLTSNIQLTITLDMLCNEKEKVSTYRTSPVVPAQVDVLSEMEKALAEKEKQIEEMKKLLATTPDYMSQLKAEAKELGVKNWQLLGEDKLKEEIEKKKK